MNSRAQMIRRLAGDFIERCRRALSTSGDDAAQYVDALDRSMAENIAGDVCATIGVEYEGPPDVPKSTTDRKKGWQARAKSGWKQDMAYGDGVKGRKADDQSRM